MYNNKCFLILEIIGHLILYASIILCALTFTKDIKFSPAIMCIAMIVIYLIYIGGEFASSTFKSLKNKIHPDKLKNIFEELIKIPPTIEIYMEKDENLNNKFIYHCSRDISGYIDLDISENELKGKNFVFLEITTKIYLADEISFLDYVIFKGMFYEKFHSKRIGSVEEKRYIKEDWNNCFLINIGGKTLCSVNIVLFVIFIRKLISTREDLNQDKYDLYNPYIKCFRQIYDYDKKDFITYRAILLKSITENDIKFSLKYKEKIPKFIIEKYVDIEENRKIGIIKNIDEGNLYLNEYLDYRDYLNINKDNNNPVFDDNYILIFRNNLNPENNNKNDKEDEKINKININSEENRINTNAIKTEGEQSNI